MPSTAYAFDHDDLFEFTSEVAPRAVRPAPTKLSPDEQAFADWHQHQFDRILHTFGEPEKASTHARLPIRTRIAVVSAGALMGWAVPIALASALLG